MIQVNRLFAVLNPAVHFFMGLSILSILGFGGFQSLRKPAHRQYHCDHRIYRFEPLVFDHGSNGDRHDPKRIDILAAD